MVVKDSNDWVARLETPGTSFLAPFTSETTRNLDEHDKRLTDLVLAVRRDLQLRPIDDVGAFSFHMIAPHRNGTAG